MAQTFDYSGGPYDHGQLSEELVAAGITPITVRGTTSAIDVVVEDGVVEATVDAVVAAHVASPYYFGHPLIRVLDADGTGADSSNAQPWFPTRGGVYIPGRGLWGFDGLLHLTRSSGGTTSHTTSLLFAGTATVTNIRYDAVCNFGDTAATEAAHVTLGDVATAVQVKAASTSATEVVRVTVSGRVRLSTAGTFIPQFKYSAAPGEAPTVQENTYFAIKYLGPDTLVAQGTWA